MGILASIMSLSMILGPVIGGAVYEVSPALPFVIAGIILFVIFFFVSKVYKKIKNQEHIDVEPAEVV